MSVQNDKEVYTLYNFIDFEVFQYDWLCVIISPDTQQTWNIVNDTEELTRWYEEHKKECILWFNGEHYDQYIFKAVMLGMNPKAINDWIIVNGRDGWEYSEAFRDIKFIAYDVMLSTGRIGLKTVEGFMGVDIRETDVDFNLNRKLTQEEIDDTIKYCTADVMNTIRVHLQTLDVFNAMFGIIKAFPEYTTMYDLSQSESRLASKVLGCRRCSFNDEFDFFVLPCVKLDKYKFVQTWFEDLAREGKSKNFKSESEKQAWYKSKSLEVNVCGVPHKFGFGGLHGAPTESIHLSQKDGAGYHVDVNNYYPSMLIAWDLVTRARTNENYTLVYNTRKELKKKQQSAKTKEEKKIYKKMQLPYKKILNALSGGMKDKSNPAYDPRNNNTMCINGQLMLLDLLEHLEVIKGMRLVQSNTDGIILWIPDTDEAFAQMDDICYEWEQRCSTDKCEIGLALDCIKEIYQGDVNNYLWIDAEGGIERCGGYVKNLSPIDNDLPIVNKAIVDFMVNKIPVEQTINGCDDLIMYQKVVKLTSNYDHVEHENCTPTICTKGVRVKKQFEVYEHTDRYTYKAFRVFASTDKKHGRILRVRENGKKEKFGNTPDHCFIDNSDINGKKIPKNLDKNYYIQLTKQRLYDKFNIQT